MSSLNYNCVYKPKNCLQILKNAPFLRLQLTWVVWMTEVSSFKKKQQLCGHKIDKVQHSLRQCQNGIYWVAASVETSHHHCICMSCELFWSDFANYLCSKSGNINKLNLTWNSRLCCHQFCKEQINRITTARRVLILFAPAGIISRRRERRVCKDLDECELCILTRDILPVCGPDWPANYCQLLGQLADSMTHFQLS